MRQSKIEIQDLTDLIASLDCTHKMNLVEIGSYAGESAEIFAKSRKFSKIICVDPWISDPNGNNLNTYRNMDQVEKMFDDVMSRHDIIIKHKGTIDTFVQSHIFHDVINSIDIVYIDGLHTYEGCKHDIEICQMVIKPRYALAGHDYTDKIAHVAGVKRAVDELIGAPDLTFCQNSWIKFV